MRHRLFKHSTGAWADYYILLSRTTESTPGGATMYTWGGTTPQQEPSNAGNSSEIWPKERDLLLYQSSHSRPHKTKDKTTKSQSPRILLPHSITSLSSPSESSQRACHSVEVTGAGGQLKIAIASDVTCIPIIQRPWREGCQLPHPRCPRAGSTLVSDSPCRHSD